MIGDGATDSQVRSVSTRVALDGRAATCTACEGRIEAGERHKVAAVDDGSTVVHREFCTRDCLEAWR